jgi:hypothetical protein
MAVAKNLNEVHWRLPETSSKFARQKPLVSKPQVCPNVSTKFAQRLAPPPRTRPFLRIFSSGRAFKLWARWAPRPRCVFGLGPDACEPRFATPVRPGGSKSARNGVRHLARARRQNPSLPFRASYVTAADRRRHPATCAALPVRPCVSVEANFCPSGQICGATKRAAFQEFYGATHLGRLFVTSCDAACQFWARYGWFGIYNYPVLLR